MIEAVQRKSWELFAPKQRFLYLFMLSLASTANYVDRHVISVLLEPIKAEFGVSDTMLGLLTGFSFALFYATLGIPVAHWADRGDRKVIITAALSIWSAMTMLCGAAASFWQLTLARIGVGAGEAGALPPSHSLIADYYPPERRAWAIAFFTLSSTLGYILGVSGGGWVAENYGWRMAFFVTGAPGLALALLVWLILKEPRRVATFALGSTSHETIFANLKALLAKPSYVNILIALVLYAMVAYGALIFLVSLMVRVHHVSLAEAGGLFGLSAALAAVLGGPVGGWLADKLAARNIAWLALLPGWGLMLAAPFHQAALLAPNVLLMVALLFPGGIILAAIVPPIFSALHVVCGGRRRAVAVAIAAFFTNLIGLGLGPLMAGMLSDWLAQMYGAGEGLRYALMIATIAFVPSGFFMLLAARTLAADRED